MYILLCVMLLIYCYYSYVASGVITAYNFRNMDMFCTFIGLDVTVHL